MSLERVWKISKLTPNSFLFSPKKRWDIKKIWAWSEFGESLEILQTHSKLIPLFQRNNEITKNTENIWVWSEFGESPNSLQTHKEIFAWCHFSKTKTKKGKMSLENLQNLSKLKKICVHNFFLSGCTHICFEKNCGRIFFWVWREFGDSPNSFFHLFWKKHFFWKMTSSKDFFVNLEWVWRFSKLAPNSYVFIFLFYFFLFYVCFFEKEEWIWSECGDSPNWLQIRSKLICFHVFSILLFFWKRGMSLEWVWRFSKLTPNSIQTQMISCFIVFSLYCFFHFCLEKTSDFGVSLGVLQTLSKLTPNSLQTHMFSDFSVFLFVSIYFTFLGKGEWVWSGFGGSPNSPQAQIISILFCVFSLYCYLKHFLGREEWEWSKFGGSSNPLQTYSKLAPNSYGFILLFLLYCQLIFYFLKKEWVSFFPLSLLDRF